MRVDATGSQPPIEGAARRFVRAPVPAEEAPKPREASEQAAPALPERTPRFEARSLLKFGLSTADVDAKFEIHKPTSTVTVTMYERETGEVLREVPSKYLLDVIASVASGRHVDTTS